MTDAWFDIASLDNFWIRRRFDVLKRLSNHLLCQGVTAAEVGCGNGLLQRHVEEEYGAEVTGFDLNEGALKKNLSRISPVYCYDVRQRSQQFRSKFEVIFLFDVLEHIEEQAAFLDAVSFHLKETGTLIVNVPAYQWLYSDYDKVAGHFRRYSIGEFKDIAESSGLAVHSYTYWGLPLVPLVVLRKIVLGCWQNKNQEKDVISFGFDPGGDIRNAVFRFLSRMEFIPQKMIGTSLMAMLRRK
jgi:SAM-dependent methyltransferase